MNTFEAILDELLRSKKKREGKDPKAIATSHERSALEALARDSVCQILAGESEEEREKWFTRYPALQEYYPYRIQGVKKKT